MKKEKAGVIQLRSNIEDLFIVGCTLQEVMKVKQELSHQAEMHDYWKGEVFLRRETSRDRLRNVRKIYFKTCHFDNSN